MKILNSYPIIFHMLVFIPSCLWIPSEQQTDCIHQCGNIKIPYPFGIGPNQCFYNKYFAVSCNSSSTSTQPKPYLKKLNLEIVEVQEFLSQVKVMFPSVTACNGSEMHWQSTALMSESYFKFAESYNVFASVGCHGYALYYNGKSGEMPEGCTSVCASDQQGLMKLRSKDQCYGYGHCCHIPNTKVYSNYGITVKANNGSEHCTSAFFTIKEHLKLVASNATLMSAYPVMLQWYYPVMWNVKSMMLLILSAVGATILMCYLAGQCWWCKTNKRRKEIKLKKKYFKGRLEEHGLDEEDEKTKLFTENELKKATDNFNENRIIGQGGQGTVYKGMLSDGKLIAVKRASSMNENHWKEFINEVIILSQINHRNVVKLLGCCLETKILHLVYEFIPNGTLSELIHSPNEEFEVTWEIRLRIASEVAGAISYLHSSSSTPIYHRDIKSSNILLDHTYKAKVCDFGISRSISMDQTHLTTCVRGTFGYFDPQYFRTRQFTEKSDVYSFGVVLVEILTGQKPISVTTSEYATSLVMQFTETEDSALFEMLDPIILESSNMAGDIMDVVKLAKHCLHPEGALRPTMMQVAMELSCLSKKVRAKVATASFDKNLSDISQEFFSTKTHLDKPRSLTDLSQEFFTTKTHLDEPRSLTDLSQEFFTTKTHLDKPRSLTDLSQEFFTTKTHLDEPCSS